MESLLFSIDRYPGPENFCDRESELERLTEMFNLKRNGVIYSYRRLGKTGLVQHLHHHLSKKRKVLTIYMDIMDTGSDESFAKKFVMTCMAALEQKRKGQVKSALKLFSQLRPVVSLDPVTGMPTLQLDVQTPEQVRLSMEAVILHLAKQKYEIQIAIDEFQQVAKYDSETKIPALLRSHFQQAKNIHYLFLGSERHLLLNVFSSAKSPLFGSMEMVHLDYISFEAYFTFIIQQFKKGKKSIVEEAVKEILRWTNQHTFYTQYFCNKLLGSKKRKLTMLDVNRVKDEILYQYEVVYINFKKLLSRNQWKVLVAIAKEGEIEQYTSKDFLNKYNLSQSSTKQAVEALIDKSMLIEHLGQKSTILQVYDVFLWRWSERYG